MQEQTKQSEHWGILKGTSMNNMSEANWQMQVAALKFAANSLAYGVFPELAERAKREADNSASCRHRTIRLNWCP